MEHRTIPKIKEDYRKGIANDDPYDVIGSLIAGHDALVEATKKVLNNWGNLHSKDRQQLRAALALTEERQP